MARKLTYEAFVGPQLGERLRDSVVDAAQLAIQLPRRFERALDEVAGISAFRLSEGPVTAVEATVIIRRPVEEVFNFFSDFRNLPSFLGDVMAVEQIGPTTSRWTIQGPLVIEAKWTVEVTETRTNELIRFEMGTSSPFKTQFEVYFRGLAPDETEVRQVMRIPFGGVSRPALALIGKPPAEEASANMHRLKQILETGRVTDTSYAVAGKFDRQL